METFIRIATRPKIPYFCVRMLAVPFRLQLSENSVISEPFSPSAFPGESITETIQKELFCLALLGSAGGLLLRLLEDLLDDLLLLDQEGTDDAVLDAVGAAGTTVGTRDVLLGTRDLSVLTGAEGRDLNNNPISELP